MNWYEEHGITPGESVGIDEVGRGPLAGPVVAAAVWISDEFPDLLEHENLVVRDSKKMTPKQRARVVDWVSSLSYDMVQYAVRSVPARDVDDLNILQASLYAMTLAYDDLHLSKKYVLVDGNHKPNINENGEIVIPIVKGDDKVLSISLASIIAKEYRDGLMKKLALEYPYYGWETNVGYGTKAHIEAIFSYGLTPHHRKTFSPLKEILEEKEEDELFQRWNRD